MTTQPPLTAEALRQLADVATSAAGWRSNMSHDSSDALLMLSLACEAKAKEIESEAARLTSPAPSPAGGGAECPECPKYVGKCPACGRPRPSPGESERISTDLQNNERSISAPPPAGPPPFVSVCCQGEKCSMCGHPAEHKVEETIFDDELRPTTTLANDFVVDVSRHPLTAYLCHAHFREVMGPAADNRIAASAATGSAQAADGVGGEAGRVLGDAQKEAAPCPFDCDDQGGDPVVESAGGGFQVFCNACNASGPMESTENAAIAAWNRRAPPPSSAPDEIEGLLKEWGDYKELVGPGARVTDIGDRMAAALAKLKGERDANAEHARLANANQDSSARALKSITAERDKLVEANLRYAASQAEATVACARRRCATMQRDRDEAESARDRLAEQLREAEKLNEFFRESLGECHLMISRGTPEFQMKHDWDATTLPSRVIVLLTILTRYKAVAEAAQRHVDGLGATSPECACTACVLIRALADLPGTAETGDSPSVFGDEDGKP